MAYLLEKMEDWKALFDDPTTSIYLQAKSQRRKRCLLSISTQALPEHIRAEYSDFGLQQRAESLFNESKVYFHLSVLNS